MGTCRVCLKDTIEQDLFPLFNGGQLLFKIEQISSVQIANVENLPTSVCTGCVLNINLTYRFRLLIISNDFKLHENLHAIETLKSDIEIEELKPILHDDTDTINTSDVVTELEVPDLELENFVDSNSATFMNKEYYCKSCGFTSTSHKEHMRHKNTHDESRAVCSICGKSLLRANMKKHVASHYGSPVTCELCGNVCKNRESLRCHMMYHKGPLKICHVCGKAYMHSTKYAKHLRSHTTPKERKYHCHLCEKKFIDGDTLKKHIRSHTGERPFICEFCKKGFSSVFALKTHRRQHTNERPYTCPICPMAFAQRVSLRTHARSKHSMELPKIVVSS